MIHVNHLNDIYADDDYLRAGTVTQPEEEPETDMTPEEDAALDKFFESGDFILVPGRNPQEQSYCYLWDEWRENPDFDVMIERMRLPDDDKDKVYIYSVTEEDGIATIDDGWHYVNRIGYFFSKKKVAIPEFGIRYW
jgi:hypothetical protein